MCCGCDTSYIVSVQFQCQASMYIYTFVVLRALMAGAASQAGDADSSRAPGLTSGLQGSVNVHRRALLLVPQWQCISSFVFYISTNFASNVYVVSSMPILFPLCHFCFFYAHLRHKSEQNLNTRVGKRYTRQSIFCKTCAPAIGLFHRGNKIVRQTIQEPKLLQYLLNMNYFPTCTS